MDENPVLVTYYRGKTTQEKDMPTSGKFNYRGDFEASKELQQYGNGLEITYNGYSLAGTLDQIAANTENASKTNRIFEQYKQQVDTNTSLGTVFIPTRKDVEENGARLHGNQLPTQIGGVDLCGDNPAVDNNKPLAPNDDNTQNAVDKYGLNPQERNKAEIVLPELLPEGANPVGGVAAVVDFGNKDAHLAFAASNGYEGDIKAKIIGSYLLGKDGNKAVDGIFSGSKAGAITGSYVDGDAKIIGVYVVLFFVKNC